MSAAEIQELQKDLNNTIQAKWAVEARLNEELATVEHMVTKLADLRSAGLWQRLKWVFTGVNHEPE